MQLHHNLYVPPSNFWQVIPPSEPPKYAQTIHIMWQNYDRKFNQENFCGLEFSQDGSLYICKLSHLIYLSSRLWRFHGIFFFREQFESGDECWKDTSFLIHLLSNNCVTKAAEFQRFFIPYFDLTKSVFGSFNAVNWREYTKDIPIHSYNQIFLN